jgi:hypothetical protein
LAGVEEGEHLVVEALAVVVAGVLHDSRIRLALAVSLLMSSG